MNKIILLTTLLIGVLLINTPVHSQELTIGSDYEVSDGSSLQIKQKKDITSSALYDNATGALTLPRVELQSPTSLLPFIDDADLANQTKIHTGLVVYNIKTTDNGLIPGIYVWSNNKWNYVTDNAGTSVITTDKTEITFTNDALEQTLELEWVPIFAACDIVAVNDGAGVRALQFALDKSGATYKSAPIKTPLGGKAKYKLKVDPLTAAELRINPVIERRTNITLSFTDPKGDFINQNVLLRQINYGVKPYNATVYPVSATEDIEFKFDVESNAAWTLSVESGNSSFVTGLKNETTGNLTGGADGAKQTDVISFTMQRGIAAGDQVVLKFTPQTAGRFAALSIILTAADRDLQPESNTYMIRPNSGTILIPVSRANAKYTFKGVTNADRINNTDEFKAELLWTDVEFGIANNSAIRSITAVGKGKDAYLSVTPGTSEGNAVIAIRNTTTDEILWSWHIWVTDYAPVATNAYNPGQTMVTNGDVYSYNNGTKTTVFMDRNLGAKQATAPISAAEGGNVTGLLYQFGRKDPFKGQSQRITGTTGYANIYDRNGMQLTYGDALLGTTGTGINFVNAQETTSNNNLENSIQNPNIFYYGGATSGGDWFALDFIDCPTNLWNDNETKTEFDPCPTGWKIPTSGYGTKSPWYKPGVITNGVNLTEVGATYDETVRGIYFNDPSYLLGFWPSVSILNKSNGQLNANFTYWTASIVDTNTARTFLMNFTPMNMLTGTYIIVGSAGGRAGANPIRCVQEHP